MDTHIDGKCPRCGRPVYPRGDGTYTHDAPVEVITDATLNAVTVDGEPDFTVESPDEPPQRRFNKRQR